MSKLDELDKEFDEEFSGLLSEIAGKNNDGYDVRPNIKSFAHRYYSLGKLEEREALKCGDNSAIIKARALAWEEGIEQGKDIGRRAEREALKKMVEDCSNPECSLCPSCLSPLNNEK